MTPFETALQFTLRFETGGDMVNGGLHTDPNDPGGTTKWGIAQASHLGVNVASSTLDQATAIYKVEYWEASRADLMPASIAVAHFDCAVIMGVSGANKLLQAKLGVTQDGKISPYGKTLAAMMQFVAKAGAQNLAVALVRRRMRVHVMSERQKDRWDFLAGWADRCVDLSALVGKL